VPLLIRLPDFPFTLYFWQTCLLMGGCISGKRVYPTQLVAEDVLIEAWTKFEYTANNGPVAVYQCEDCGQFHLTSRGPMNERLAKALADGKIQRLKEADRWLNKLKRK
jgi:hypothetical protein